MSTFSATTLDPAVLDPRKRVRYATGLVLGVDEFQQDQTYLTERDRRHQRALHGYGTVWGLDVRARVRDGEAEVVVAPGLAVDPRGRDVCVPAPQCARLDAWLDAHADDVRDAAGSFPDALALYVVLCYRECETDLVPLPGSPCRSEDDATVPSRIADHFELQLALEPPAYAEEPAVRRFGRLLRRLRVSDEAPVLTAVDLTERVRSLADGEAAGTGPLHVHPDDAADLIRLAMRVWAVEVRPTLGGEGGCAPPPGEACVLLARVDLQVAPDGDGFRLDPAAPVGPDGVPGVRVRQQDRPYLVSTRVLQEWLALLAVEAAGPGSFPDGPVLLALNDLIDVETAPADGDVLAWDAGVGAWTAQPLPPGDGGVTDHGALTGLGDDDHPQYLPVSGARPMAGALDMGGNRIGSLAAGGGNGEAVVFEQAVKNGDAAGGDLAGTYPNPVVGGLRGRPVSNAAPSANQVLGWNGSAWAPRALPAPEAPETNFEEGLVRIMGHNWRHGFDPEFLAIPRVVIQGEDAVVQGLVVEFGREGPGDAEVRVGWGSVDFFSFQVHLSVFQQALYQNAGVMPAALNPVRVRSRGNEWVVDVIPDVDEDGMVDAPAVLFRFPPDLGQQLPRTGAVVNVLLRGDLVRDREGRAIDAEYLRQQTPTGDRPEGRRVGLQGGRFESWFLILGTGDVTGGGIIGRGLVAGPERPGDAPERPVRDVRDAFAEVLRGRPGGGTVVDLNTATREELTSLPNVGRGLADRIIEAREAGGFDSPEALRRISGVSDRVLEGLRGRVRTGPRP